MLNNFCFHVSAYVSPLTKFTQQQCHTQYQWPSQFCTFQSGWKNYDTGYLSIFLGCVDYQVNTTTEWCSKRKNVKNICDGSKEDCLAKGEALCSEDNDCYGVMYHPGWWSNKYKGVMFCQSTELKPKPDWETYLKCSTYSGNIYK